MEKTKILILQPVRLDGQDREPGETAELDNSLLDRWRSLGYCEVYNEVSGQSGARLPNGDQTRDGQLSGEGQTGNDQLQDGGQAGAGQLVVSDQTGDGHTEGREDHPELKHLGGGYYEMPDGSKVRGKEEAIEALKAFKQSS
jgi:hypothetical protein